MSKNANPGELRVPIIVEQFVEMGRNENRYPVGHWENVFGEGQTVKVKWVNAHGTDVFEAMSLDLRQPVTITSRFSPRITPQCRFIRAEDAQKPDKETLYYEIIDIDNVEERGRWLEIKAQRKAAAT